MQAQELKAHCSEGGWIATGSERVRSDNATVGKYGGVAEGTERRIGGGCAFKLLHQLRAPEFGRKSTRTEEDGPGGLYNVLSTLAPVDPKSAQLRAADGLVPGRRNRYACCGRMRFQLLRHWCGTKRPMCFQTLAPLVAEANVLSTLAPADWLRRMQKWAFNSCPKSLDQRCKS